VTVLTLGAGAPLIGAAGAWLGVSTAAITAGLLTAAAICALYGLNLGVYGATGTNVAHNLMGDTVWYDIWNILGIAAIVICAAFVIACVAYIAWAALFAPKKAEQIQQTAQITSNNASSAPTLTTSQQASVNKVNNVIANNLTPDDFSAVLRELQGNPIAKPGGGFWDHITEMTQSYTALKQAADSLRGSLLNPNLNSASRQLLQSQLDSAVSFIEQIENLFQPFGGIENWLP